MSYYCSFMKYQMMVDLKQQGKNKIAPCCHFDESIEIDEFEEKTSSYFDRLMNGEKIPQCKFCWKAEDAGLSSVRTGSVSWKPHDSGSGIKRMDIRIHNKCNLACTMCYSGASNLWGKLEGNDTTRVLTDDELSFIRENAKNITHLSLQGGEPFYGSDYDDFLMSIDNLSNISVDVFTNVISIKREVIQRWHDKLRDLIINASVDGYGKVYDSIRWPTTWGKFEKNAKIIYDIVGKDKLTYYWTMQTENLNNIFDFIDWRDRETPGSKIETNMVMGSEELGISSITLSERTLFNKNFRNYSSNRKMLNTDKDNSEYNQMKQIHKIVMNTPIDNEKVNKKQERLMQIYQLRESYKGKENV